ncbi:S53 family peptidase [Dyella flagellata]|uniref:Kumamolisin n=1 Tax=Dyella flagellata TaxID=1867833 RepID=A0ABQ5X7X6_9GAMM|nr:S53 family peptidase [Dyella flagellata]GLQ86653.1 kumamolisin [Dyella flagellata]
MIQHAKHPSHWTSPAGVKYLGPHQTAEPLDVTVVLRRRSDTKPAPTEFPSSPRFPRGTFGEHYGADPADVENVRGFARKHGLAETGCDAHRRVLHLRGTPKQLEQAFAVSLGKYQLDDHQFIGCGHAPTLPAQAIAVLGLDRRPVARPHFRVPLAQPDTYYSPLQLAQLYNFPAGTDGTGQTIGIIELGGGYTSSDLDQYFSSLGIGTPPNVVAVSVAGGQNQPGGGNADIEVTLDIEVAGALAPGATLAVYFAPNTDQGFYEAISQAAHDTANNPSVISISWGGPEDSWNSQSRDAMETALQDAAALGVTVVTACGDNGSSDGVSDGQPHVDFPSSSPYSLACGGTTLVANGQTIQSEVVWNETASNEGATGGGVSIEYPMPSWQQNANVPNTPGGSTGRGVPDVCADADPMTGYEVLVGGQTQAIGGTSAAAPLWAGLLARINQQQGKPVGDLHAALYQIGASALRDITQGNNGAYQAGPGWDACTGLGSPNGQALLDALSSQQG